MQHNRIPWPPIIGAIRLDAVLTFGAHAWPTIRRAYHRIHHARPGWLALGGLAVAASDLCAGQIYGRVLDLLGYRLPQFWLITAVLAAYGLALIVSTFTVLPGGDGTVEAALGATIIFRMCSYWLLLPLGAIGYRFLTSSDDDRLQSDS